MDKVEAPEILAEQQPQPVEEQTPEDSGITKAISKPSTNSKKKKKREKVFFISLDQLSAKKIVLEEKLKSLTGNENKRKRLNIFKSLGKINKAIEDPQHFMKDPKGEKVKKDLDNMRRVTKKIEKKKLILLDKRRDRNRERSLLCLYCKKYGHSLTNCTERGETLKTNMCYNCGGTDHELGDCPKPRAERLAFAVCFICKEQGHLAKNCSQNTNGMYFKGGGCYFCGSNMHVKRDCPERKKKSEQNAIEKEQRYRNRMENSDRY